MLRHWKYACRAVAFLLLLAVCLSGVNCVLLPKYYVTGDWPTTSTYLDFYNLEQDTVDVLFLGSSHAAAVTISKNTMFTASGGKSPPSRGIK